MDAETSTTRPEGQEQEPAGVDGAKEAPAAENQPSPVPASEAPEARPSPAPEPPGYGLLSVDSLRSMGVHAAVELSSESCADLPPTGCKPPRRRSPSR
jgi:hypothetical protein